MEATGWKSLLRVVIVNCLVLVALVGVVELAFSTYRYFVPNDPSIWVFEDVGKTIQFDPIRGYTLTQTPSRSVRITKGVFEYIGTFRGNAQGFPSRHDFTAHRGDAGIKRLAVFGDSFSAAQFLAENWPDRVEDLTSNQGRKIELLNFSIDGAGLANWESVIRSIVKEQRYELDGLVFAACCNDVDRTFAYTDDRNRARHAFAYVSGWDPQTYPKSLDATSLQTLKESERDSSFIVSSEEFDQVLKGRRLLKREWHFAMYDQLRQGYWRYMAQRNHVEEVATTKFDEGQLRLMEEIRAFANEQKLPMLVVYIGGRTDSINRDANNYVARTKEFAKVLGAEFIDGRSAFEGMKQSDLERIWLPYDGHWGLGASDVFAGYMAGQLTQRQWGAAR